MSRRTLGLYLIFLGIFMIAFGPAYAYITMGDTTDPKLVEDAKTVFSILLIPGLITIINGFKWRGKVKFNKKGYAKTKMHFYTSLAILYLCSLTFGSFLIFLAIQYISYDGTEQVTNDTLFLCSLALVLSMLSLLMIRSTMRNDRTLSEMYWNEGCVYNNTSLFRIIMTMFLPLLILFAIAAVLGFTGAKVAYESMEPSRCPICGRTTDGSGYCPYCHSYR